MKIWRIFMRMLFGQRRMRVADRARFVLFIDRYLERRWR